ncbi:MULTISPECIES: Asp23/Gls24 family envelope stress response protein [Mycobacteriaceae]|uniref:Alkaline shock protein 23 n=1 Tax=Mycolicibacterium neoaurum VKM Ac-1815D TaxID=700508 RepID=V5XDY3_MYCNE|nr:MULTISPECIES: Asp23/Gls24 family envelope stress response protein [Mycobacteriaceae]AHC26222.1 alkaline shock protein 23 [Mycolicibacterium neoaurum VKM Ac-1815D]AMO06600.1 alkaline shock protein 23 [Mycolicibacterium neoaurum]AXK75044.1 Asp23/Gls24 family envelope stress response protein [Mycolicibacterium neoaurum]KJQ48423.1 alkaline shock protein 23 [Mycolicibacterium neoaurum]KUM06703.1 alkaline-shock protein [Mycolicibacterium neoaurum]
MTTATPSREVSSAAKADSAGKELEKLASDHGVTTIADVVVSKIAGIATREVDGVYDLGGQAARVVGKLRETLPGTQNLTQGVNVEVGERQAAVDIGIVAEYGVAIHDLADGIRNNVISAVENMTGLEVTEVNITVHDVHFADDDNGEEIATDAQPRVQ